MVNVHAIPTGPIRVALFEVGIDIFLKIVWGEILTSCSNWEKLNSVAVNLSKEPVVDVVVPSTFKLLTNVVHSALEVKSEPIIKELLWHTALFNPPSTPLLLHKAQLLFPPTTTEESPLAKLKAPPPINEQLPLMQLSKPPPIWE